MKALAERVEGTMVLRAPADGVVQMHAPKELCGELEVYEALEPIASLGDEIIVAPAHGFVLRLLARDGEWVAKGSTILEFRVP